MVLAVAIMMRNERVEIVLVMSRAMAPYNVPWLFPCHVHGPAKIQLHEWHRRVCSLLLLAPLWCWIIQASGVLGHGLLYLL